MNKFELHIDVTDEQQNIITYLKSACSLSNTVIKQAIDKGALWHTKGRHTQRLRRIKKPLNIGEKLHFYYDENVLSQSTLPAILINDSNDYSVWYKPYGMLSQGSKWSDHCTIQRWAEKTLNRPTFIVHRLDRAASGLIVVAHAKKATRGFSSLFEQHDLDKQYQVIVHGHFPYASDEHIETSEVDGKHAKSRLKLNTFSSKLNMSLVDVQIETGRKHQIREHCAGLNFPVVGDRLHGDKQFNCPKELNLQLCAVALAFECPITQTAKTFMLPDSLRPNFQHIESLLNER